MFFEQQWNAVLVYSSSEMLNGCVFDWFLLWNVQKTENSPNAQSQSQKRTAQCGPRRPHQTLTHLVHVDVIEVWGVVDGLEETLELTGRSSMDDQDEGDSYGHQRDGFWGVLIPPYVNVGLAWKRKRSEF